MVISSPSTTPCCRPVYSSAKARVETEEPSAEAEKAGYAAMTEWDAKYYKLCEEKGVNVVYVELNLVEVKEVEPQYTDTQAPAPITQKGAKNPADTSTQDKGKMQPQKPQQSKLRKLYKGKIPLGGTS